MLKEEVILNQTKMILASGSLACALKGTKSEAVRNQLAKTRAKIEAQSVKSFGDFSFNVQDAEVIAASAYGFWEANKKAMLADNTESGRVIRKDLNTLINEFSATVMSLANNVEKAQSFRAKYYVDRLAMNC